MSLLLGVRRWPYIRMFHIAFFPLIIVQNMAHRNTGRLQAKVIQRSHWAWCIQNHSCRHWGGQHKYTPIYDLNGFIWLSQCKCTVVTDKCSPTQLLRHMHDHARGLIHSHKTIHTYEHIHTLHSAPQGHCAISFVCGFKETELIDILANRASWCIWQEEL